MRQLDRNNEFSVSWVLKHKNGKRYERFFTEMEPVGRRERAREEGRNGEMILRLFWWPGQQARSTICNLHSKADYRLNSVSISQSFLLGPPHIKWGQYIILRVFRFNFVFEYNFIVMSKLMFGTKLNTVAKGRWYITLNFSIAFHRFFNMGVASKFIPLMGWDPLLCVFREQVLAVYPRVERKI